MHFRRGQQSSAVVVPKVGGAKPLSATGGRLNNAAEFAVTKLDDLVNWGRRVNYTLNQSTSKTYLKKDSLSI